MAGADHEGDEGRLKPGPGPKRVFTAAEKLAEIKREIALRRRVYGRLVESGSMKQDDAEFRIRVMEAIAADYRGPPPPQLDLGEPS